ncbi:hypothetical protein [Cerasicoccus frondis]|uniref:hypothetical protein n=1 Tax=Cerasicoccus frondis TaxID=490090 RepID=UPI002852B1FC|nr:hypothetical protein [Cerasicoccus frondis]
MDSCYSGGGGGAPAQLFGVSKAWIRYVTTAMAIDADAAAFAVELVTIEAGKICSVKLKLP